jgi:hypothetical protein
LLYQLSYELVEGRFFKITTAAAFLPDPSPARGNHPSHRMRIARSRRIYRELKSNERYLAWRQAANLSLQFPSAYVPW